MGRRGIFLDRDGVLNHEVGYVRRLEDLTLLPGAAQAVRGLNDRGWFCGLASNQAGAARGYYDLAHIDALHDRLRRLLWEEAGARLDAVYACTALGATAGGCVPALTADSTWRKPNPGMLVAAAWEWDVDLRRSFMVGDKATDIDLARNCGCGAILVGTGYGDRVRQGTYQHPVEPDFVAADLAAAVAWLHLSQNLLP
ncbi:MAG: HAD family hydrolase [Oscillatoriales cyanobacterium SM2_1_8]|nr:HAD family hydrolase [Oscillatoriales cyanobacterium SM2_1_8]